MTERHQVLALLIGIVVFLYCSVALFAERPGLLKSADGTRLRTLDESEVLRYIQSREFAHVDVVLMPPFVVDGDQNLSIVSVMRFMPWFRRMHIFNPADEDCKNLPEYWKSHMNAKFVMFNQNIVEYALTSPFLEERFVVLRPLHVLSNYTFSWHFFVDDSPVIRSCQTGVVPLTRSILNECVYLQQAAEDVLTFATQKGISDGRIRYVDNLDRFRPPCSSAAVTTVKNVGSVYKHADVRDWLQFEEPRKDRARPFKVVLVLISTSADDLRYELPVHHAQTIQIWINLTDAASSLDRLAFTHRMIANKNVFVEISPSAHDHSSERIGAEVMRQISGMSRNEAFKVLEVFSYGVSSESTAAQLLANETGNKLGRAYNAAFGVLASAEESVRDRREWTRLRYL